MVQLGLVPTLDNHRKVKAARICCPETGKPLDILDSLAPAAVF